MLHFLSHFYVFLQAMEVLFSTSWQMVVQLGIHLSLYVELTYRPKGIYSIHSASFSFPHKRLLSPSISFCFDALLLHLLMAIMVYLYGVQCHVLKGTNSTHLRKTGPLSVFSDNGILCLLNILSRLFITFLLVIDRITSVSKKLLK